MKARETAPAHSGGRLSPNSIVTGVVSCFSFTVLAAGALAVLLALTPMTERMLPPIVNAVGALSVFAGGFVSGRHSGGIGWLHGGLAGVAYTLACFVLAALVFPDLLPVSLLARRLVLGFGIGAVGGMAGINV